MEWNYLDTKIVVKEDGYFHFEIQGYVEFATKTLGEAKKTIEEKYKYKISKEEAKSFVNKLNAKEYDFFNSLLDELSDHENSAYCEQGVNMKYKFDYDDFIR